MYEDIEYEVSRTPDPQDLLTFYESLNSTTTQTLQKLQRIADHSFCFVLARRNNELIGMARGVTDGVTGYLAECKLDPAFQGPACITRRDGRIEHDASGIAREMAAQVIAALRASGVERIEAVAYGTEVDFCEDLGFRKNAGVVAMSLVDDAASSVSSSASDCSAV